MSSDEQLPDEQSPEPPSEAPPSKLGWLKWYWLVSWSIGLAFVGYIVVLPVAYWVYDRIYPPESIRVIEDMSVSEQVRLRTMETMTALWFFALGGTIGSFLNVVAYRVPLGKSVVFGTSSCPQCGNAIRGRDNVPIFGWLWLRGRCRDCQAAISPRYPIVESICATLFVLLFFVELISGGANIPVRSPNIYHGVLWIIFYTKWDLVGLYLYHCFAFTLLFTCVLIDIDRTRLPWRFTCFFGIALLLPAVIWPDLLPVPLFEGAESWIESPHLLAAVSSLTGGMAGAVVGWLTAWGIEASTTSTGHSDIRGRIAGLMAIVGMSLGWQASIAVTLIALFFMLIADSFACWRDWSLPRMPAIVLTAFVVHHVVWRWTFEYGATWWPTHKTTAMGWFAIAAVFVALLAANRVVIQRKALR